MYIKKVKHKNVKNGIEYCTYKIIESVRTEAGPRTRDLLNLGSNFRLDKNKWKDLANRIEEIITGQESLIKYDDEIEILAKEYSVKLIRKQRSEIIEPNKKEYKAEYETIDINSIENEEIRTIGAEHAVYETIKSLELDKALENMGFSEKQAKVAIGIIAGRLIMPGSERATHRWLREMSGIDELLNRDFSMLSKDSVYNASDNLLSKKNEIEKYLREKTKSLFNLQEQIILYDLTNTFFEGTGKYNNKARRGRSKEKRSDCPIVTLGLVLDEQGFPKKSKVFDGNISEPKTLKKILDNLSENTGFFNPTVVLDAGIATEDNIKYLKKEGFYYLVVSRRKKKKIPQGLTKVTIKNDKNRIIEASIQYNDDESELYCHSTTKELKEDSIKNCAYQRFEDELKKMLSSLGKKNGIKSYEKVIERLGRVKQKSKLVSHHYNIEIKHDTASNIVTDIIWNKKQIDETNGVYVIRTNRQDLSQTQIWDIYSMLTDVEDAFRAMKSELGLRPVYHKKEHRVDGHLFITVLAYYILQVIRFNLRINGINDRWETIRNSLSSHVRISTIIKTKDSGTIRIRKSSNPEIIHQRFYNALNISSSPSKTFKSVI